MPPTATIRGVNPRRLRYADLDGATLTVALHRAAFNTGATPADFDLLGPPLGVSITAVDVQATNQATLTLAYRGPVLSTRHDFAVRVRPSALSDTPDSAALDTGRVKVKPNPGLWSAPLLALYLLAVGIPALLAAISQWTDVRALTDNDPATTVAQSPNILLGLNWHVGSEELLIIFVASIGVFFACLAGLRTAAAYLGSDDFESQWWLGYLIRPIVGAGVAIATYWTLRAAFLGEGSELQSLNTFGIATIAAIAGLFARNLIDKLRDIADALFPTRRDGST